MYTLGVSSSPAPQNLDVIRTHAENTPMWHNHIWLGSHVRQIKKTIIESIFPKLHIPMEYKQLPLSCHPQTQRVHPNRTSERTQGRRVSERERSLICARCAVGEESRCRVALSSAATAHASHGGRDRLPSPNSPLVETDAGIWPADAACMPG